MSQSPSSHSHAFYVTVPFITQPCFVHHSPLHHTALLSTSQSPSSHSHAFYITFPFITQPCFVHHSSLRHIAMLCTSQPPSSHSHALYITVPFITQPCFVHHSPLRHTAMLCTSQPPSSHSHALYITAPFITQPCFLHHSPLHHTAMLSRSWSQTRRCTASLVCLKLSTARNVDFSTQGGQNILRHNLLGMCIVSTLLALLSVPSFIQVIGAHNAATRPHLKLDRVSGTKRRASKSERAPSEEHPKLLLLQIQRELPVHYMYLTYHRLLFY
eukprot:1156243-Pelagomonas_calceolata.AAC.2